MASVDQPLRRGPGDGDVYHRVLNIGTLPDGLRGMRGAADGRDMSHDAGVP